MPPSMPPPERSDVPSPVLRLLLAAALAMTGPAVGSAAAGTVTFRHPDGHVYRVDAHAGAVAEDVSAALQAQSPGSDLWLNVSPDGRWLVLETDRFDPRCVGWECLALVAADSLAGGVVLVGGEPLHTEWAAVASTGDLIVFEREFDLWSIRRTGGEWSEPLLLTGASPFDYNSQPALAADGASVVFDCGPQPYGATGTAICEVGADGGGLHVVLTPAEVGGSDALHHPDYAPDGSIVFEGDAGGERIWRLPAGGASAELVGAAYGNDNSPCVLPDGRVVSLWLGRPGGAADHELKVMSPDGASFEMLLTDVDVLDIGLGCGGPELLLADGFESGGLAAWSGHAP